MTATDILSEIYGDDFFDAFKRFKVDAFSTVYKGAKHGHELKHRITAFAIAACATADQQSNKGRVLEAKRMLRWVCQTQAGRMRGRIRKILARKKWTINAHKLDTLFAGRYERYLMCIPTLIEMGYVGKDEERALDEYLAEKGLLWKLEKKLGATA